MVDGVAIHVEFGLGGKISEKREILRDVSIKMAVASGDSCGDLYIYIWNNFIWVTSIFDHIRSPQPSPDAAAVLMETAL